MNKKIFFSLLLITTLSTQGMKRPNNYQTNNAHNTEMVLSDQDIMSHITRYLCVSHNYKPYNIRTDIRSLSNTNQFFHDYYAQEKVAQAIIRFCSEHNNSNDKSTARNLGCHKVYAKIERFTNIALKKESFTADDAKEKWYLSMTTTYKKMPNRLPFFYERQPLLCTAIEHLNTTGAKFIIDYAQGLNFCYQKDQNPLLLLIKLRHDLLLINLYKQNATPNQLQEITQTIAKDILDKIPEISDQYLHIAEELLKKGILADGRGNIMQHTPLMYAIKKKDKAITHVLLAHNANPNIKMNIPKKDTKPIASILLNSGTDPDGEIMHGFIKKTWNTYGFAKGETWFQEIVDEIEAKKTLFKYWLLKNYMPCSHVILPRELALLIIYKLKTIQSQIDQSVLT